MKIGRNSPCPCDSGKKYKKCCIGKKIITRKTSTPTANFGALSPNGKKIRNRMPKETQNITHNVTGELYYPIRLHYKISNKYSVQAVFRKIRCMKDDKPNKRWVWLYTAEAKTLKFPIPYRKIPQRYHPIVIGSFFQSRKKKNELHLDVRSIDRVKSAVVFFYRFIPSQHAKITHISLPYRFVPQKPELNIKINFDYLYANKGEIKTEVEKLKEKIDDMLEHTDKYEPTEVLQFLNDTMQNIYPETDKLPISYHGKKDFHRLEHLLTESLYVATERRKGNENIKPKDFFDKITKQLS